MKSSKLMWNEVWANSKIIAPHEIVLQQIKKLHINHVLEIGAGSGVDVEALVKMGYDVTFTDLSEVAIEKFKLRELNIKAKKCDARNLPFKNNSFDLVYCLGLLEHFGESDRQKIIKEMLRVSKRYILIDVPQRYSLLTIIKKILMFFRMWKYGDEIEFTTFQLINEVKRVDKNLKICSRYGRGILPLPRNFRSRFYKYIVKGKIKDVYFKLQEKMYWCWFNCFGIIFEKEGNNKYATVNGAR